MAAFRRRPSTTTCIALCLGLALAGCSLVAPVEAPAGGPPDVARLVREGRHADAAQAYAALATPGSADRHRYALKSAEQWLAAGNAAAALRELERVGPPPQPADAQQYWWLCGRAEFGVGDAAAGVRAYVERERSLADPAAVRASRDELFSRIRAAAAHGDSFAPPPGASPVIAGWLALGSVALELDRNPMRVAAAVADWRARFPNHPANDAVTAAAQSQLRAVTEFPRRIALLLPLSGAAGAAADAVRDGFVAAYLQQDAATRPRVQIYDVAAAPLADVYRQALADGADFVVGPLTKQSVAAIAPLAAGRVPVLALNFLDDGVTAPPQFYQFALRPEDEARSVARRLAADGRLRGVAIVPDGAWGGRVATAFSDELTRLGGAVLALQRYEPSQVDFTDIIVSLLQIHEVKGEPVTHRPDAAFVFVAGSPQIARLVMPQLKFHFAGDIPVYSMPDGFAPDPNANADVDGMLFPDMPWMISSDPVTAAFRDAVRAAWPAGTSRFDRLYAFGIDAFRLVPALRSGYFSGGAQISGMTGTLRLDDRNRIRRGLDWATIDDGAAKPL